MLNEIARVYRGQKLYSKLGDEELWVYGYLYSRVLHLGTIAEEWIFGIKPVGSPPGEIFAVKPETITQHIGLEDFRSKKIFSGDIVDVFTTGGKFRCAVEWYKEGCQYVAVKLDFSDEWFTFDDNRIVRIEVVGNKFDTPELLNL